jgi:glycosyltransferase involved in cell wall biosynthesis
MTEIAKKFSILITTKNRVKDLAFTLEKIKHLIARDDLECRVFDDGSVDGTSKFITDQFPKIILNTNEVSKGYLYCRNKLLSQTNAEFAISLDDDAHFITQNPLEIIADYFNQNPVAGLLGCRVFWSSLTPSSTETADVPMRVKSFVGCGHVWRMKAWREIPKYPEWFVFYGEEDFASYQLFKKGWEIHYLPAILVHHRVDIVARKNYQDYSLRLRRSLSSGWKLFFLFYPLHIIPKKLLYSVWIQLKLKVFKGDMRALKALVTALVDLFLCIPKIVKHANRLTQKEYRAYQRLPEAKIYWHPEIK